MSLTWGKFKEWVSQFVPDNVEIHYIDVEFPREDRVDIDIDEDRGLGISTRGSGVAEKLKTAIWYDPDSGDDANDGRTPETPVRTPGRVLTLSSASQAEVALVAWDGTEWTCVIKEEQ